METTTNPTTTPATFQVGNTYSTGEGRDYVWRFQVVKRTKCFITLMDVSHGRNPGLAEQATFRVGVTEGYQGHEIALPLGTYSMAPVINADQVFAG